MIQRLGRDKFVLRPGLLTHLMQRFRAAVMPLWGSENASNHPLVHSAEFDGLAELTTREHEILRFISQGFRDRAIAKSLSKNRNRDYKL
jgi:DNA-binding NarL/FixJ family response regulator